MNLRTASNKDISKLGLGLMGMSEFYGDSNDIESTKTIHYALNQGINFLDTADMYGSGHNEKLLGSAIKSWSGNRDDIFVCTKFGIQRSPTDPKARAINGRPEYVKQACDASLQRLEIETIDLYYQHRVDPTVPIEDTVGAMKDLVEAGKVRYLGLSEASVGTISKALTVHPIAALQSEYSLWSRHLEKEILPYLESKGIRLVAYSPLGRGFLTGSIKDTSTLAENDFRRNNPRFQDKNLDQNLKLIKDLEEIANNLNLSPGQVALSWIISQNKGILPIPGTRKISRIDENLKASAATLDDATIHQLNEIFAAEKVAGFRYAEAVMKNLDL
ncbi:aldo/keto reductase [Leptospira sp. GIMC2001]|uniref:aldo/keto reductase n=1 Tax=Leptospira sp. GIMC2001 TaxID=1513297 RepID=UPI00234A0ECE|nr:aldo/keto reductase [Leptospira sp. GIMC2001]WCL49167.1 aldo/keto reductase [Leptospira sp. GIMC2001]